MSLYTKPINDITFEDVQAFCTSSPRPREGVRLDFKQDFPRDLAKSIASFANTLGGVLLIGVSGDAKNEPIWPPPGIAESPQNSERVNQISESSVYPPMRVELSRQLPLPSDPSRVVLVVRVPQSAEAPHAVDSRTGIYTRTGDISNIIERADVDQIERFMKRRWRTEEDRERLLTQAFERTFRQMNHGPVNATRWMSFVPLFPSAPICTMQQCFDAHQKAYGKVHAEPIRAPGGSFSVYRPINLKDRPAVVTASINHFGLVLVTARCMECADPYCDAEGHEHSNILLLRELNNFIRRSIEFCSAFYNDALRYGGMVQASFGIKNCGLPRLAAGYENYSKEIGPPYPDPEYRSDTLIETSDLSKDADWVKSLKRDFMYCFNFAAEREF